MNKSRIIVILDRSGSMSSIASDAIGGFNQFLHEQKKLDGEATISLYQFDDSYDVIYENVPLQEAQPLTTSTFIPRGMTALYDAIGKTLKNLSKDHCPICENSTKTIVAILTDGQENSSREFTQQRVNEMIRHQRDSHKWEFIFLAANQDAFETGSLLGIKKSDTFNFVANSVGTRSAYTTMSTSISNYRINNSKTSGDDTE